MYIRFMGENQPLSRYGDVWAGFCSKVIYDHLGLGVKISLPCVWYIRQRVNLVGRYKNELNGLNGMRGYTYSSKM
ncbi:hypothetical protein C5167_031693 [Papaver somniferum]|uniref:Uncharacterized protein n=1 Tax=Papaver somniferum TaxID=3469 RepID=A0A4Y7K6B6_PAPSO|nr:hypothetical protein C5167_031693 [Papaver somniferum]